MTNKYKNYNFNDDENENKSFKLGANKKNTMELIKENQFNYLIKLSWYLIFQSNRMLIKENEENESENNKSESKNSENENEKGIWKWKFI